jgi:diguanylate cyclase (GGDEF)-like protein
LQHRGPTGELLCVSESESHALANVRARQVWIDLDSVSAPALSAGTRLVYFYSSGRELPPALPAGLFVRKPCAPVLFEALWADLASRSPAPAEHGQARASLPGWLIEFLDLSLAAFCRRAVTSLAQRLGYRYASIYLVDSDDAALTLADTSHTRRLERRVSLDELGSHPMIAVARQGRILRTEQAREEWHALQLVRAGIQPYADEACLIAPLIADGRLLGVLNFCERTRAATTDHEEPLTEIIAFLGRLFGHARMFEQARTEARVDSLTGLYNQRWMTETLGREIRRAERFETPLSALMVDLDGMKAVNDRRGHAAGDDVLRQVGRRIAGALRQFDGAARIGGDEFFVLLPATNIRGAEQVGLRVLDAIRLVVHDLNVGGLRVTASVGAAEWHGGLDPAAFTDLVDRTMYRAKQAGGDRVVCHVAEAPHGG